MSAAPPPPPRISRPAPTSMPPRGLSLLPALPSIRSNGASVESHYDSPSAFTSDAPPPNGASISDLPAFPFDQFAEDTPAPPHGGPAHASPEMRQGSPVIYPSDPPVVPFEPSLGARLGPLLREGWAFAKAHPKDPRVLGAACAAVVAVVAVPLLLATGGARTTEPSGANPTAPVASSADPLPSSEPAASAAAQPAPVPAGEPAAPAGRVHLGRLPVDERGDALGAQRVERRPARGADEPGR